MTEHFFYSRGFFLSKARPQCLFKDAEGEDMLVLTHRSCGMALFCFSGFKTFLTIHCNVQKLRGVYLPTSSEIKSLPYTVFCFVSSSRPLRSIGPPFRGFLVWKCASVVSDQSTDCTSSTHPDMTARAI
jgi:hypothetical protein